MHRALLRPSIVVSLVLHGAALSAAALAAHTTVASRGATLIAFVPSEEGVDAAVREVAPPPDPALEPLDLPELRVPEFRDAEARVPEAPPSDEVERSLEPDARDVEPRSLDVPALALPPVGARTTPRRPAPTSTAVAWTALPPPRTVAAQRPALPSAAPAAVGAARVSVEARGLPTNRRPVYPPIAERNGWTGVVWLVVEVLPSGRVGDVTLDGSSGYAALDAAALEAVRTWTYEPRLEDGVPTRDLLRLPVRFLQP